MWDAEVIAAVEGGLRPKEVVAVRVVQHHEKHRCGCVLVRRLRGLRETLRPAGSHACVRPREVRQGRGMWQRQFDA